MSILGGVHHGHGPAVERVWQERHLDGTSTAEATDVFRWLSRKHAPLTPASSEPTTTNYLSKEQLSVAPWFHIHHAHGIRPQVFDH